MSTTRPDARPRAGHPALDAARYHKILGFIHGYADAIPDLSGLCAAKSIPPAHTESRGEPFQLELPGLLLPFSYARPPAEPQPRRPKRQGQRTPAEVEPLKTGTSHLHTLYSVGACCPSGRLMPSIHPAVSRCRKAGESRPSRRGRGHGRHTQTPGRQPNQRPGGQSAKGSEPPQRPNRRKRT